MFIGQPEPLHIRQLKARLARLEALKVLLSLHQMIAALEQNIADSQNDESGKQPEKGCLMGMNGSSLGRYCHFY
ncbi:hypothetical protein [Alysiella filiformis]|uniref:Uncharacterized protein n=1 Tax=Alysiella filiformis DSM 16848 TaxID=1120981 RepID=A0A286EBR4_9NEIS|nr:hypothetical protein [Alysiella filiformis]QMT31304.1 hypothetical protein H3L97_11560 [Alysiella filiformis]UBQ55690.1 hypothetical protein JF568_08905 [Alysiella filiformis DSM 16848]SOD68320.1 hypothetical protein SAMN02746062_01205 [Alysiella filiformis DSM 16848]